MRKDIGFISCLKFLPFVLGWIRADFLILTRSYPPTSALQPFIRDCAVYCDRSKFLLVLLSQDNGLPAIGLRGMYHVCNYQCSVERLELKILLFSGFRC